MAMTRNRPSSSSRRDGRQRQQGDAQPLAHHLLRRIDVVELHDPVRGHASLSEERVRQVVVARRAVEEDQPRVGDLIDADRQALAEGWLASATRTSSSSYIGRLSMSGCRSSRTSPEIDVATERHLQDLLGVARAHAEPDARMPLREALEQRRQHVGADGGAAPSTSSPVPPRASRSGGRRPRRAPRAPLGVGQEGPAGVGQGIPRRPRTKRGVPSSSSSAWSRRSTPAASRAHVGRPAQVALAGDLEEAFDLGEQHASMLAGDITSDGTHHNKRLD
jgi:hypothetical protein